MTCPNSRIAKVTDNNEKARAFQKNFQQYNKAKNAKCYFECLWILYALLEDRTSALLYHLGVTSAGKRSKITPTKKIKKQLREIFGMPENTRYYGLNKISGKLTRIFELADWAQTVTNPETDYQKALQKTVAHLAKNKDLKGALVRLETWRDKRNQLIHALFNKKPEAVEAELYDLVEGGYADIRILDQAATQAKKYNLRDAFRIH